MSPPRRPTNGSVKKRQWLAFTVMMAVAVLAGQIAAIILGVILLVTLPIGIGFLILLQHWDHAIMYLYPCVFVGELPRADPVYFMPRLYGLGATLCQWLLISWAYSVVGATYSSKKMIVTALCWLPLISFLTYVVFAFSGLQVVSANTRM